MADETQKLPETVEELNELIRKKVDSTVRGLIEYYFDTTTKGQIAWIMKEKPELIVEKMFGRSGQVVRTEASQAADKLVISVMETMTDDLQRGIREYVTANLHDIVQKAVADMIIAAVATAFAAHSDTTAKSIMQAFTMRLQNASINVNRY